MLSFLAALLLSTFFTYWLHRLAHVRPTRNPLWKIHKPHHLNRYDANAPLRLYNKESYDWKIVFFWFGGLKPSLDVWINDTLPTVIAAWIIGGDAWYILPFHYAYHILLSGNVWEHNLRIKGALTRVFACGRFHMQHHKKLTCNYGFITCLWDYVFGTYDVTYIGEPQPAAVTPPPPPHNR